MLIMLKNNNKNIKLRRKFILVLMLLFLMTALAGCKNSNENTDSSMENVGTEMTDETDQQTPSQKDQEVKDVPVSTSSPENDGGGNEFKNDSEEVVKTISVLVSKEDFYYENARIDFDELMKVIEKVEGKLIVEVTDDSATYKAYNKLIEKLTEMEIEYIEK